VVDEIHERDRFADFLLILLRDALPAHPHLRLARAYFLPIVVCTTNTNRDLHEKDAAGCCMDRQ